MLRLIAARSVASRRGKVRLDRAGHGSIGYYETWNPRPGDDFKGSGPNGTGQL